MGKKAGSEKGLCATNRSLPTFLFESADIDTASLKDLEKIVHKGRKSTTVRSTFDYSVRKERVRIEEFRE